MECFVFFFFLKNASLHTIANYQSASLAPHRVPYEDSDQTADAQVDQSSLDAHAILQKMLCSGLYVLM